MPDAAEQARRRQGRPARSGSGVSRRDAAAGAGGSRRRVPRPATPERLEKAALAYLERFAASSESLRRVLRRRVRRSAELHGTDPAEGEAASSAPKVECRWLDNLADSPGAASEPPAHALSAVRGYLLALSAESLSARNVSTIYHTSNPQPVRAVLSLSRSGASSFILLRRRAFFLLASLSQGIIPARVRRWRPCTSSSSRAAPQ